MDGGDISDGYMTSDTTHETSHSAKKRDISSLLLLGSGGTGGTGAGGDIITSSSGSSILSGGDGTLTTNSILGTGIESSVVKNAKHNFKYSNQPKKILVDKKNKKVLFEKINY